MKFFHIIAGLLALVAGATALYATKGSWLHRRSGIAFAVAMLIMSASGATMAALMTSKRVSVVAGVLTFYLVSTGWLTVRRSVEQSRQLLTGFMLVALTTAVAALSLGIVGVNSPNGRIDGLPAQPLFLFFGVATLGALGDARLLWTRQIEGARRIARHLWRMSFAMWIATASFFLGQAKLFPQPLRKTGLLAIPVVLVLAMLVYWFLRVRFFHWRGAAGIPSPPHDPRAEAAADVRQASARVVQLFPDQVRSNRRAG